METWKFKFPTFTAYNNNKNVYAFNSTKELVRGGGYIAVAYWDDKNLPVVYDYSTNPPTHHVGVRVDDDPTKDSAPEKSGGSVDYYQVQIEKPTTAGRDKYTAECNDIIEALGMNYAEGNAFKAIWRSCAERTLGKKKVGGNAVYDAEKVIFFGARMLEQRKGM